MGPTRIFNKGRRENLIDIQLVYSNSLLAFVLAAATTLRPLKKPYKGYS